MRKPKRYAAMIFYVCALSNVSMGARLYFQQTSLISVHNVGFLASGKLRLHPGVRSASEQCEYEFRGSAFRVGLHPKGVQTLPKQYCGYGQTSKKSFVVAHCEWTLVFMICSHINGQCETFNLAVPYIRFLVHECLFTLSISKMPFTSRFDA